MKALAIAAATVALQAHAALLTCDRTELANGAFRLDCVPQAAPTPPPGPPTLPTEPTPPTPPTPPGTPPCPPHINPMICSMLGYGQPTAPAQPSQPTQPPSGESLEDPAFVYRCGSLRRIYGPSGSKSVVATYAGSVTFTVGESGMNETQQWHVSVARNGTSIQETDVTNVFYMTPAIAAQAGDMLTIAVASREPGKLLSVALRLSVDGC